MCVPVLDVWCVHGSVSSHEQRFDAKNRPFVFTNFDPAVGKHHFHIPTVVTIRVRERW